MQWTSMEATVLAGITYRQLHYWREQGWIVPANPNESGPGSRAVWNDDAIEVMRRLRRASDLAAVLYTDGLAAFADALDSIPQQEATQ